MSKSLTFKDASAYLESLLQLALSTQMFQVQTCFNVTVPESWHINERVLDEIHILYVKSGRVTYQIESHPVELTAGNILFLSDGIVHSAYRNLNEPLSIIPIRFKINQYKDNNRTVLSSSPSYFSFLPRDIPKFLGLFEAIHRYFCHLPSIRRDALCHSTICQIVAEIAHELEYIERHKPIHPAIMQIKNHIDLNPADRLSVENLTALSGLSAKYGSRLFQQLYGHTIKEYQIKVRIEYARYLLEQSNQSVKEISFQLGYPDPFVFSKQYKAVTGTAPSKVLKRESLSN